MILRAKTIDLLQTRDLGQKQKTNSVLNLMELQHKKTILSSYPRRIVLELTNSCNLNCIMCGREEVSFNKTFFDLRYFEKLKDALEVAEEVTLFGWGEPLLHPQFERILQFVNRFPVRKYFVTNGTLLGKYQKAIFDNQVDIIAVSLDGASTRTNDRIRRGSNFEQIIGDVSDVIKEKKLRGVNYPYINFVFTTMKSNLAELPSMVKLAHQLGVEEVKSVILTTFSPNLLGESLWNHQDEVKKVFNIATNLAESLNIKIKLPYLQGEDPAGDDYHKPCYVGWRDFYLGSDEFIRPCQSNAMKLFHINKYSTFEEMWNSKEYQDFRSRVNIPTVMPVECKRCYQSSYANWNKKDSFIQVGKQFAPEWGKVTILK